MTMTEKKVSVGEIPLPDFPPDESEYQLMNLQSQGVKLCGDCGGRIRTDLDGEKFCPQRTSENQKYCPMLKVS